MQRSKYHFKNSPSWKERQPLPRTDHTSKLNLMERNMSTIRSFHLLTITTRYFYNMSDCHSKLTSTLWFFWSLAHEDIKISYEYQRNVSYAFANWKAYSHPTPTFYQPSSQILPKIYWEGWSLVSYPSIRRGRHSTAPQSEWGIIKALLMNSHNSEYRFHGILVILYSTACIQWATLMQTSVLWKW